MNHARNFVLFLWVALGWAFVRNIGLYDGFRAIFGSVYLLTYGVILAGISILYLILRSWIKRNTAIEPSPKFRKGRAIARWVPVLPTIAFFMFAYTNDYGPYTLRTRDFNPASLERLMDALGNTLNLTFLFYAIIEFLLMALLWQARKERQTRAV
ncbi:hypothetical protein [Paenibacillus methanolicus]|uniref:Uncharacterized protein n=1 Tax=Paenibacillus methanolicus TaxID=582686 RepID=A0A5S5C3M3_9BACL|nr:hypothetical protein [Paenibacillus methanolicus]TYP73218.1 hypothetical protein BCM02_107202 [Paenibacillus methanolicus]